MGSHKSDSLQSFNLLNLLKKLCKCHRLFQILSIRVYILTKEHNFYHTICHKSFNLANDIFWITASLTSTHIRYDTVAAEIVTSEHDVNTGFEGKFTFARDSEKLVGVLELIGYKEEPDEEKADFVIYNTCTVRENANLRVYGRLGQLGAKKKKNPQYSH